MALNVNEWIERMDPEWRRQVEERAAELIAEEMTLREQRKPGLMGEGVALNKTMPSRGSTTTGP